MITDNGHVFAFSYYLKNVKGGFYHDINIQIGHSILAIITTEGTASLLD